MKWFLVFLVFFQATPAFAQEVVDVSLDVVCKSLPDHIPDDSVEYKPGAEDVVPADLNPPLNTAVPGVINIPITVKLAEKFPAIMIPSDLELQPDVGSIAIHQNGRVEYNGQDISGQVYSACAKGGEMPQATDGQEGEDAVSSPPEPTETQEEHE